MLDLNIGLIGLRVLLRAAHCTHLSCPTRRVSRMIPPTGMFCHHPVNLKAGLAHVQLQLAVVCPVGV